MSLTTNGQREAVGSAGDGSKGGGRRVRGGRRGRRRRPPVENKPGEEDLKIKRKSLYFSHLVELGDKHLNMALNTRVALVS